MQADRSLFDTMWQEISDHVLGRHQFTQTQVPGQARTVAIYDTTGMLAGDMLAAGLGAMTMDPAIEWFQVIPTNHDLRDNNEALDWTERVQQIMFDQFYRPGARFITQMHETHRDLVHFNTACLIGQADPDGPGMVYNARPTNEIYLAETDLGKVNSWIRRFELTSRQAVSLWGKKVPKAMAAVNDGKSMQRHEYVHWVRPNNDVIHGNIDYTGRPWAGAYVDVQSAEIVQEEGFFEAPYMTPRWEVDAGEIYGRGPGLTSLPEVKMLSKMNWTIIKAAEKAVDPPLLANSDLLTTQLRTGPGSITTHEDMGSGRPIVEEFGNNGKLNLGVDILQLKQAQTQEHYHHRLLELVNKLNMTATEVNEHTGRMKRHLAPILGRHQEELLHPVIRMHYAGLARQGLFPDPPEVMHGQGIQVEFLSAVQQAQRELDARKISDYVTFMMNQAQAFPEAADVYDSTEGSRAFAKATSVPHRLTRSNDAVQQIRQQREQERQQAEAEAKQAQQIEQLTKAAPALQAAAGGDNG